MENNQIVNIEVGSLDNLLILSNLRLIGNKIVAAGMIQVGLYFEYSNNLLQSYYISPLAENVNIENNVIKSLQCGNVSNVRKFYVSSQNLLNLIFKPKCVFLGQ